MNSIVQELKSEHTSLKKIYKLSKTNWAKLMYFSLILRKGEQKQNPNSLHLLALYLRFCSKYISEKRKKKEKLFFYFDFDKALLD